MPVVGVGLHCLDCKYINQRGRTAIKFYVVKKLLFACLTVLVPSFIWAQHVEPYPPLPSARQLQWAGQEFYLFVHFGPNTFTDLEWGKGSEKEEVFNPTALDCRQWCRIARAAGAKGIIITAKHHDGFCLWPSAYSTHTVRESKWENGKGDVLQQLSAACREYGLKMGVYLSPWDRNHPQYGTPGYNEVFINMMKEVVHKYGPFFEFWWDGANGEGPNGKKQVYEWMKFEQTMRTIAPATPVFSDIGPDIRWVGNENGIAGKTNWSLLDTAGFTRGHGAPSNQTLNEGNENGKNWIQAECDVSIRPGWFYHAAEDTKVKTPQQLFQLYLKSVGRNASLLLNVPPDRRGLISAYDSAALIGFKQLRDENFKQSLLTEKNAQVSANGNNANALQTLTDGKANTYITAAAQDKQPAVRIKFKQPATINCVELQEPVQMGQRVKAFALQLEKTDGSIQSVQGTTIGRKRILSFTALQVKNISVFITDAKAIPLLSEVNVFHIDDQLVEKE